MKRLVGVLFVTASVSVLGCGVREGSSEGMVWHLMRCRANEKAKPEERQEAENAFRNLMSRVPTVKRFEWGKIDSCSSPPCRDTHWLLLTLPSLDEAAAAECREALAELGSGLRERSVSAVPVEFLVHDATPQASTATRGHRRRAVLFHIKKETTPEEIGSLEDALPQLPSMVPTIERLQWGTATSGPPSDDPATYGLRRCLLMTFKDANARDECLAHPSYKELESMLTKHSIDEPFAVEYVAR